MEGAKEKISNISASAKAGMDKTKATAGEKVEKMKTRDPLQKEMAEQMKEERIREAELEKQQAYQQSAHQTGAGQQTGLGGHHTGVGHQTGLGQPAGGVTGLHGTGAPAAGTKTNPTEHGTGGGLL